MSSELPTVSQPARKPGTVAPALRAMHSSGLLGKFLPEFGHVTRLMQYDHYHRYTIDEHTLRALGLLDDVDNLVGQVRFGDKRCLEQAETAQGGHFIDISGALQQAMILHRRAVTLHKELMAAERALAEDGSETSLAIIRDLQLQLSALDGMEAERDRLGGAGLI